MLTEPLLCPGQNKPGATHKLRGCWTFQSPDRRGQPNAAEGPPSSASNSCHPQAFLRASRRWSFTQKETAGLVALELGQPALQGYPVSVEYLPMLQLSYQSIKTTLPTAYPGACEDWWKNYCFLSNVLEISVSRGRGVPTARHSSTEHLMNLWTTESVTTVQSASSVIQYRKLTQ